MRKNDENLIAVIRSSLPPTEDEKRRLSEYLKKVRGIEVPVTWEEDGSITDGFQMEVGSDIYDWTISGRLRQFKESLDKLNPAGGNIIPLIRETVQNWTPEVSAEEMGEVLSVGDEIATVSGLEHAAYGEILQFSNGVKGMVQDLTPDRIGCILFGDSEEISEGSIVRRTGRTAGIPVGDAFLGRVVDALGSPIDGKGDIPADGYRPIEMPAPSIVDRQPVNTPMETGLIAIDSMFPIGRGQRELIIGDRQTGKTRRGRALSASTSPSARRPLRSPSWWRTSPAAARWSIRSSSTLRLPLPPPSSISPLTPAVRWASTSCIRGGMC